MNTDRLLTGFALAGALLTSLHFTDDIARGIEPDGTRNLIMVAVVTVWLWAILLLERPRVRYVILFFFSLAAALMPVAHRRTMAGEFASLSGGFFSIWLLIALSVVGCFSAILCVRGLWGTRTGKRPEPT